MKPTKTLGLVLVVAIAATALIGVSSASAHRPVWCERREPLCATQWQYRRPAGGRIIALALATKVAFENNGLFKTSVECAKSNAAIETEEPESESKEKDEPLAGKLIELTFTECKGPCKKVEAKGLPWKAKVTMTELESELQNLVVEEGSALFSECTLGVKCEFGVPTGKSVSLMVENDEEGGVIKAEKVELEYKSGSGAGICGTVGFWTATYHVNLLHLRDSGNFDIGLHFPAFASLRP
jgi:hypothetical protein